MVLFEFRFKISGVGSTFEYGGLKFVLPYQGICYHNIHHAYHALYFSKSRLETF